MPSAARSSTAASRQSFHRADLGQVASSRFQPNADSGEHTDGAIEIFYVLSGELEHVVNGKSYIFGGMAVPVLACDY